MPEKSRLQPPASLGLAPTLLDRLASQGSLTRGEKKRGKKKERGYHVLRYRLAWSSPARQKDVCQDLDERRVDALPKAIRQASAHSAVRPRFHRHPLLSFFIYFVFPLVPDARGNLPFGKPLGGRQKARKGVALQVGTTYPDRRARLAPTFHLRPSPIAPSQIKRTEGVPVALQALLDLNEHLPPIGLDHLDV